MKQDPPPPAAATNRPPVSGARRPRYPMISTSPAQPDSAAPGDVWLRNGQVWGFTKRGWRRYG